MATEQSKTRAEHLQWAKDRALEYLSDGDTVTAFTSLTSDLTKHDELRDHPGIGMGMILQLNGHLSQPYQMREFIEGFN